MLRDLRANWTSIPQLNPISVSEKEARDFFEGLNSEVGVSISKQLRSGMTVFDIGGNAGFFSWELCRAVPEGLRVFLFEPVPNLIGIAEIVLRQFPESDFTFVNSAVGDRDGSIDLFLPNDGNIGWVTSIADFATSNKRLQVSLIDIAPYLRSEKPDFIKIDVEGAEGPILRRIVEQCCSLWCPLVYVELGWGRASANWTSTLETLAVLNRLGYEFALFDSLNGDFSKSITLEELRQVSTTVDLLLLPPSQVCLQGVSLI
jgi:FkbM family methyltransferase